MCHYDDDDDDMPSTESVPNVVAELQIDKHLKAAVLKCN